MEESPSGNIPPSTESQPTEKSWYYLYDVLILFSVLALLVSGLYFWKHTKLNSTKLETTTKEDSLSGNLTILENLATSTSDKVYTNVQFSFELVYPPTWRVVDRSDGVVIRNYYNPFVDLPPDHKEITIRYLKNKNPEKLDVKKWFEKDKSFFTVKYEKTLSINNLSALEVYFEGNLLSTKQPYKIYEYLIPNGQDIIIVDYQSSDGILPNQVESIIKSIKIIPFDSNKYSNLINSETQEIIGEDKNSNGVWDYIENYINTKYSYSAKIRAAGYQYVKGLQSMMIDNRDETKVNKDFQLVNGAIDCFFYIDDKNAHAIMGDIEAELLNTNARSMAYLNANGQSIESIVHNGSYNFKNGCNFDSDKLPN